MAEQRHPFRKNRLEQLLPTAMQEHGIDLWIVLTREYTPDPLAADVGLEDVVGRAAGIFSLQDGALEATAVVSCLDTTPVEESGLYGEIVSYSDEGALPHLRRIVREKNQDRIGVNLSEDSPIADGLGVGLFRYLQRALGPGVAGKIAPAEEMIASFRSRRLPAEIDLYRRLIDDTDAMIRAVLSPGTVQPGVTTEKEVAAVLVREMEALGATPSWRPEHCPNVWVELRGHGAPSDRVIQRGDTVSVDFGICVDGLRTDLQRTAYVRKEGEAAAPEPIQKMFQAVVAANRAAVAAMKPGATGLDIDTAARSSLEAAGFESFGHATGHPLGFATHEIGPLLGPDWPDTYGSTMHRTLEAGQIFAVEPSAGIEFEGKKIHTGLEEDVLVTDSGAEYLSTPQEEILLI